MEAGLDILPVMRHVVDTSSPFTQHLMAKEIDMSKLYKKVFVSATVLTSAIIGAIVSPTSVVGTVCKWYLVYYAIVVVLFVAAVVYYRVRK